MLKLFFETIRSATSGLATVIGRGTEENYVERPWTDEEEADFSEFVASIGRVPEDKEWAAAMEDGEVDFFNNDVFVGLKMHSC